MNESRTSIAMFEIPMPGWSRFNTVSRSNEYTELRIKGKLMRTFVGVRRISLLAIHSALPLFAISRRLRKLLLVLCRLSRCLGGGTRSHRGSRREFGCHWGVVVVDNLGVVWKCLYGSVCTDVFVVVWDAMRHNKATNSRVDGPCRDQIHRIRRAL